MGTNPAAFRWPRPDGGACVFDFAISAKGPPAGGTTCQQVAELDIAANGPPPGSKPHVVLDPAAFGTDARTAGESFFADALSQPGPRLPGQRRLESRRRSRETGAEVSQALLRQIEDLLDG